MQKPASVTGESVLSINNINGGWAKLFKFVLVLIPILLTAQITFSVWVTGQIIELQKISVVLTKESARADLFNIRLNERFSLLEVGQAKLAACSMTNIEGLKLWKELSEIRSEITNSRDKIPDRVSEQLSRHTEEINRLLKK